MTVSRIKVRLPTKFPSSVTAESPLLLDTTGGAFAFSLDADALTDTFGALYQPLDDTLNALAALDSTAGLLTQTALNTFVRRTLTGTAAEITVTNGDGVSGAPTISIPSAVTFTGKTVTGGTFAGGTFTSGLYNKVTITTPATAATLTLIDGTTLTGPASSGTVMTLGNVETVTGAKTFNDAKLILAGVTSGTTTLKSGAIAGTSVLTLPIATDTLMGKATTDVLTNKTLDSAGTGNVLKVSGVTVSSGQYPGETTTGSATAGNVGEYIEAAVTSGSAVSLASTTAKTVVSISLTAGDWDVDCSCYFLPAASTTVTQLAAAIHTVTDTLDTTPGRFSQMAFTSYTPNVVAQTQNVPPYRFSLSSTTTIFMVAKATFGTSTLGGYGLLRARRVR